MKQLLKHEPSFELSDNASRQCKEITSGRTLCNKASVFMVRFPHALDPMYNKQPYEMATSYFCVDHFDAAKQCVKDEWASYLRYVKDELTGTYYTLRPLIEDLPHPVFTDLP